MNDSFGAWISESGARRGMRKMVWATVLLVAASWAFVPAARAQAVAALRDGAHDFDFNIGVWHTHIRRIPDPWSGSDKSVVLDGTVTVRKVFDGRAQLEEIEADGPNGHWEGLTLFLYNPQAHQWSQSFIDNKAATLNSPEIGAFHDGRGELFSSDTFNGKAILVRAVWSNIAPDSHRFEESYSNDGGKTWAPAFVAELTREKAVAGAKMVRASATSNRLLTTRRNMLSISTWERGRHIRRGCCIR